MVTLEATQHVDVLSFSFEQGTPDLICKRQASIKGVFPGDGGLGYNRSFKHSIRNIDEHNYKSLIFGSDWKNCKNTTVQKEIIHGYEKTVNGEIHNTTEEIGAGLSLYAGIGVTFSLSVNVKKVVEAFFEF